MTRRALAVLLLALGAGGCFAEPRIARLRVELAEDVRHGREAKASVVEKRITTLAADAFGMAAPETIRVRTDLAESWAQWKYPDRALALASATLAEVEQRHGPNDEKITPALLSLARIHFLAHHWNETERTLDRISRICRATYARTDPPADPFGECRGGARNEIHRYYLGIGAYGKWSDEYLLFDALGIQEDDRSGGISMLTVLGRGYAENGAYPEARWYLQRCVDELGPRYDRPVAPRRKVWSTPSGDAEVVLLDAAHSFHSQSPRCLEDLVDLHRRIGNEQIADDLGVWQRELWSRGPDLEKVLADKVRFADYAWHADFLTSSYANDLAFYYAGKGRNADALRAYEEAVGLIDRAIAKDGVFAGVYPARLHIDELLGLGEACEQAGRFADAEVAYRRAAEIAARELHPRHAWRLEGVARLARVLTKAGSNSEAEAAWRRYLSIVEEIRGRDHADYAFGLSGLARTLAASGRHAEAAAARARAASITTAYALRVDSVGELPLPASLRSLPPPAN